MHVVWENRTKDDFRRIGDFLKPFNPAAAARAARTIRIKAAALSEFPEIGSSVDDETGRQQLYIPFGKNGYVLHYIADYDAGLIRILRVWHTREDRDDG